MQVRQDFAVMAVELAKIAASLLGEGPRTLRDMEGALKAAAELIATAEQFVMVNS